MNQHQIRMESNSYVASVSLSFLSVFLCLRAALWKKTGHFGTSTIIYSPTSSGVSELASERMSERSGECDQSEQCGANERVSDASEQADERVA